MAQLRQKKQKFDEAGARVVLVGMGSVEESSEFTEKFDVPFSLISDPERELYQAFGLKKASVLELLSPSVGFKALSAVSKGHSVGMPIGDIRQLPGVFIINTNGEMVFEHYARDASDHPAPETILQALKSAD